MSAQPIGWCRLCGHGRLTEVLDLGMLSPSGVFPRSVSENPTPQPIRVVRCDACGLCQLAHHFQPEETFNAGFGYRSATNDKMRAWMGELAERVTAAADLKSGDLVVDIGSNDGTFLSKFLLDVGKVGVDPVAGGLKEFYPHDAAIYADFWNDEIAGACVGAKAITAFACLYDLPDPNAFMANVAKALAPDGVFMCEVAYLPGLMDKVAFDIISSEHLEYYDLTALQTLMKRHGMTIIEAWGTDTQGSSVLFMAKKTGEPTQRTTEWMYYERSTEAYIDRWRSFRLNISDACRQTHQALDHAPATRVHGLCASTKGATLLQVFGLGREHLSCVSDAAPHKVGRLMPGSLIPIVSEEASRVRDPDVYYVLSHQFADGLIERERAAGFKGQFIVPLPSLYYRTYR